MNVRDLHYALGRLIDQGHGDLPLYQWTDAGPREARPLLALDRVYLPLPNKRSRRSVWGSYLGTVRQADYDMDNPIQVVRL